MASHGLKNPLTIIKGNISLLKNEESLTQSAGELVESVRKAQEKMMCLINEFLENAIIEEGSLILNLELANVNRLIKKAIKDLEPKAISKKQTIQFNRTDPVWIKADETYFLEILDNLISNSIKYSQKGTRIWIDYQIIPEATSTCIGITVKDEGQGMTEADLEAVFTPFATLSAKSTGGEMSTGLGLAITKQLVNLHGGEIKVKSSPNKGCEFIVKLPVYEMKSFSG